MYQLVDDNLRLALQFFGRASGKGAIDERNGILLIDSGVDYAVFNIAIITEPVDSVAKLELRVSLAAEFYAARRTRWSLWVCEDLLDPRIRLAAPSVFARHHLHTLTQAPGMVAENLLPLSRYLPSMEYKVVGDAQTRTDFAHLTTICFDIPFATSQAVYQPEDAWKGDYVGYVGYLNRRAICTAAVVISDDAVGLYSIGTVPEYRRRGYAEALVRQVLQDATRISGIRRSVLQATRAGHEMYRRLGYRDVTKFSVYIL